MNEDEKEDWAKDMTVLLTKFENLLDFTQTNILGFRKILKKFDKYVPGAGHVTEDLWPRVTSSAFIVSEKDEILYAKAKTVRVGENGEVVRMGIPTSWTQP